MADGRRVGHAQRRRIGAPSNVYDDTTHQPSFGVGDVVRAGGRYGPQTVVEVHPNVLGHPGEILGRVNDGHGYTVEGGKGKRRTFHGSASLTSFGQGSEEG